MGGDKMVWTIDSKNGPKTRMVNGVKVNLTPEEQQTLCDEWNTAKERVIFEQNAATVRTITLAMQRQKLADLIGVELKDLLL